MSWYPHAIKLLQKFVISNKAINMHSRGSTEQYLCALEPHHGCLHKVKKCPGAPSLKRANGAINMHSRGPTLPSKWKMSWYPHAIKLLKKFAISNKAINMHSSGSTEQYLCALEPHHGCLHKVKKYPCAPSLKRANGAINMHSRGPTLPSKWKMSWYLHVLYYWVVDLLHSLTQ